MPRDNRHEANARQSVRIGGRKVMSRGGIVGARPGRTSTEEKADALVAFADAASGYAGRQSAEMEQEQTKAQRLQAYKDFHEDGTQDVSREQAKERGAFADADYARTYSRLSYAEKAKDLSEDIHQHTQTMMDDPTIGIDEVEAYIDATTSGAIQGVDDPDAVEVFANRLTSDAEQLKTKARGVAIERQKLDGRAKLNARMDDMAAENLLGRPEARATLEDQGKALNIPQSDVHAAMTDRLIRKAEEAKDPAMLAPLFKENDDGVSLADNPDLRSTILQARDDIEAEAEEQTSAAELTQRYDLHRKVNAGSLSMRDIQSLNREHPDWYTPDQLATMLTRSQSKAQAAANERRETTRLMSGRTSPASLAGMPKSDRLRRLANVKARLQANHEDTPEGQKAATRDYLTFLAAPDGGGNIVTDDRLKDTLTAGALSRSQDGSVPDQFKHAYAVYRMTRDNPELRGLTGNLFGSEAEAKLKAYDQQRSIGMAGSDNLDASAYNAVNLDMDKPIDTSSLQTREAYDAINKKVNDLTDTSTWTGMLPGVSDGPGLNTAAR